MKLLERIQRISVNVEQQIDIMRQEDEEAAKQVSVTPFIEALGYDTRNLLEVKSQFMVGNEWVDYAIKRDGQPIILVEAKRARDSLSENRWTQLQDYFSKTEARFAILTNGIEYKFYTDLRERNVIDRLPFLTLNMIALENKIVNELEAFTKNGFDPERIVFNAKKRAYYRSVAENFEHPSDDLVTFLAGPTIASGLTDEDTSLIKDALDKFINDKIAAQDPSISEPAPIGLEDKGAEPAKEITSPRVRGIIEIPVHAEYEGLTFEATLLFDPLSKSETSYLMSKTKMRYDGEKIGVNDAELKARQSIAPDAKQNWKGWKRWKLRDPSTGESRAIKELLEDKTLRDQFLRSS